MGRHTVFMRACIPMWVREQVGTAHAEVARAPVAVCEKKVLLGPTGTAEHNSQMRLD